MVRETLSYGGWISPVSAAMAAGKSLRFGMLAGDGDSVYWIEGRPEERGRGVIMRAGADGGVEELLRAPWSARSKVHEYGGGEFLASGGTLWFVEADSQDIYVLTPGDEPTRVTEAPDCRFADISLDRRRGRLVCVCERHRPGEKHAYPENFLGGVSAAGASAGGVETLVAGSDFYAAPRVSPGGDALAWLSWDLPAMPWETAALHVAPIGADGAIGTPRLVAGGEGAAAFQPEWGEDGRLYYVCDESGWGNLYAWDGEMSRCLLPGEAELMRPLWVFGMRSYALLSSGRVAAATLQEGESRLVVVDADDTKTEVVETGLRDIDSPVCFGGDIAALGVSDLAAPAIVRLASPGGPAEVLRSSFDAELPADDVSLARTLEIGSGDEKFHAFYYPPANAAFAAPEDELPPVIVTAHGGPTGRSDRGLKVKTQYWTSRGFGFCDVDYSGSAGYGRDFRSRLDGQWGVRDVDDVVKAARALVARDLADPKRLLISGSSAGGYTVLLALAGHDLFAAGACTYGVSDLAQLQRITHKFEAGYLYGLIGCEPEDCDRAFAERSPINRAGDIGAPVIFFQGEDDKVVPPQQSRSIADTLRRRGLPVAYYEFPGEGHGFRQAATIERVLTLEHAFYCSILGIDAPEASRADLAIDNWPE